MARDTIKWDDEERQVRGETQLKKMEKKREKKKKFKKQIKAVGMGNLFPVVDGTDRAVWTLFKKDVIISS